MSANPPAAVMDLLQGRLGSLVGRSSGYVENLPKEVRQRVRGLKGVQANHAELETKFHEEVLALEKKYADLYKPLYERRAKVVSGKAEPTEAEIEAGKKVEAKEAEEEGLEVEEDKEDERITTEKGIPEFWLTALKNHPQIADLITERDEEPLRSLTDIRMSYLEENPGFRLSFHFNENDTFTNSVLTKTYYYQSSAVAGDLVYDRAEGSKIDWKPNQDLSVTVETKKQRHKGTNKTRVVKKTVPAETFFSFFTPPVNPSSSTAAEDDEDEDAQDEDLDERLEADYELGEEFKEKVVPHAIDWFTGKALQYEGMDGYDEGEEDDYYLGEGGDEDDDEDDDEEDEDEDDEDDDENDDKAPAKDEKAPECKQQ